MNVLFICGQRRAALAVPALMLAVAGVLLCPVRACGDGIGGRLAKEAPQIVAYLRQHHLTTLGVLRFRVKKGSDQPTWSAGPMNANMVTRLENVLAVASDDRDGAFQLLVEPGKTISAKNRKLTYLKAKSREELFTLDYEALGAKGPFKAQAFLFGTVSLSDDYTTTTVTIYACTPAKVMPEKLTEFSVATDRNILADVGENFIITRRGKQSAQELEAAALRSWAPNKGVPNPGGGDKKEPVRPPDLKDYVEFKVFYDDKEQSVGLDKDKWHISAPQTGQKIRMSIKNVSNKDLAVVLSVNGENTILGQEGPISSLGKYVLKPNEEETIKGFLQKNKTVAEFTAVSAEEAEDVLSKENVGMIQVGVFESKPEKEVKINLRRVTMPEERSNLRSLNDVKQRSGLMRGNAGVIVPDPAAAVPIRVQEVDFPDASLVGVQSIKYLKVTKEKKDSDNGK